MSEPGESLTFVCPHCGGPLHVVENGDVECRHEHRLTVSEVLLEQARTSSQATWQAVSALRQRAHTSRWAARDPELYGLGDADSLEASAQADEGTADELQRQAQALDLTVSRITRAAEGDGAPL